MTTLERIILWFTFLLVLVVGGVGWNKVNKMRTWANQVIAFTDHLQEKHSEPVHPPKGDHIPPPPPPPDW